MVLITLATVNNFVTAVVHITVVQKSLRSIMTYGRHTSALT